MKTRLLRIAAATVVLGMLAIVLGWRLTGGTWVHVQSPSMGTTAPVGSLLWVHEVPYDDLLPGDFITFRPPGSADTYSHRVLAVAADGSITTKGDIPGPDPWVLHSGDVVGEVSMVWRGVGWLVVAAPVLLAGLGVALVARRLARDAWRLPATLVVGAVTVSVAIVVYQPLIGAEEIAFAPDGAGARATYVGTGLLPVRLVAEGSGRTQTGDAVTLRAGEVGSVQVEQADADGRFRAALEPAIPTRWWALLVLLCFLPAAISTIRAHLRAPQHRVTGHHSTPVGHVAA